jgi:hypothetical protein
MQAMPIVEADSVVDFLDGIWAAASEISQDDNLTGTIPTDIYSGNYCKGTKGNNAQCTFGGLTKLKIKGGSDQIQGKIPTELGFFTALEKLELKSNKELS